MRKRVLSSGLNGLKLIWFGPESDAEIQADFNAFFERTLHLTGLIYFQAEQAEIDDQFREWATVRKCYDWQGQADAMHKMRALMPPSKVLIMDAHGKRAPVDEQGWLSDLKQYPGSRGDGSGTCFPTQLTHGTIFSWDKLRPATPLEHLHAQGFHVRSGTSQFKMSPVVDILTMMGLKGTTLKKFSGNGMHLMTLAAWVMYVFTHIGARPEDAISKTLRLGGGSIIQVLDSDSEDEADAARGKRRRLI